MVRINGEICASIIVPHFDAVRDCCAEYSPVPGQSLDKLRKLKFLIDESIRDTDRHFAGCREDGSMLVIAPQAAELPVVTLVAILSHECGHAADFLYPARWVCERGAPARWVEEVDTKRARKLRKLWNERSRDQVEWDADSIAWAMTGRKIGYCGPCLLQCFEGGGKRPKGLR